MADLKIVANLLKHQNRETTAIKDLLRIQIAQDRLDRQDKIAADQKDGSKMAAIETVANNPVAKAADSFFDKLKNVIGLMGGMAAMSFLTNPEVWANIRSGLDKIWEIAMEINDVIPLWKVALGGIAVMLATSIVVKTVALASTIGTILSGLGAFGAGLLAIGSGIAAIGAGPIAAGLVLVALVANTIQAFYQSIKVFKEEWDKSGSFMEALNQAFIEFVAQFLGWPLKLGADLINWVANLLGFEDIIGDFDPVQGIRDFFTDLRVKFAEWDAWMYEKIVWIGEKITEFGTWIYNSDTGEVFGMDFGKLIENGAALLVNTYDNIMEKVSAIGKWFYNSDTGEVFGIDFGKTLADAMTFFVETDAMVKEKIGAIGTWFYDKETGKVFGIDFGKLVSDIVGSVTNLGNTAKEKIGGFFSSMWEKITGAFANAVNGIIDKINYVLPKAWEISKINLSSNSPDEKAIPRPTDTVRTGGSEADVMAAPVLASGVLAGQNEAYLRSLGGNGIQGVSEDQSQRITNMNQRNRLISDYNAASGNAALQADLIKQMQDLIARMDEGQAATAAAVINQTTNNSLQQAGTLSVDIPDYNMSGPR